MGLLGTGKIIKNEKVKVIKMSIETVMKCIQGFVWTF